MATAHVLGNSVSGDELLKVARMVAAMLVRAGQQGDIDYDDLYGAAALGAWRAQLALKPDCYEEKQRRAFVVTGARREALGYLRKETRNGKKFQISRPASVGFDEATHGAAQQCSAIPAARLREIWSSRRLTVSDKRLLANAARGVYPPRKSSDTTRLRNARLKLRKFQL